MVLRLDKINMRQIEKFIQEKLKINEISFILEKLKINSNSKIINDINDDELLVKLLFEFIIDHKVWKKDFNKTGENQFNYKIIQHTREVAENFYNEIHNNYKDRFILQGNPFKKFSAEYYFIITSKQNDKTYIMLNINDINKELRSIDVSKNIMELLIKK